MKLYFYNLLHNCLAHFLMGICGSCCPRWLIRFHDWSATKAWPGLVPEHPVHPELNDFPPLTETYEDQIS